MELGLDHRRRVSEVRGGALVGLALGAGVGGGDAPPADELSSEAAAGTAERPQRLRAPVLGREVQALRPPTKRIRMQRSAPGWGGAPTNKETQQRLLR